MRTRRDEHKETSLQMDWMFFSSSPVWAACRKRNLLYLWWPLSFWKLTGLSFFCFFRFLLLHEEAKLDVRWHYSRWPVWSMTCHMWHVVGNHWSGAQGKFFERRGVRFEQNTWNKGFQQVTKVHLLCKEEFNGGRVPHLSALPAGWRNAKRSDSMSCHFP